MNLGVKFSGGWEMLDKTIERVTAVVFAVAIMTFATEAASQQGLRQLPSEGKFSVSPMAGTSFTVGGDFVNAAEETFAVAGTIGGAAFSVNIGFKTEERDFGDVYDQPIVVGLGLNYGLSSNGEVFGSFRYVHAGGDKFDALNVTAAGTIDGTAFAIGAVLTGEFDSYNEFGVDVGYRHFFNPGQKFRPFVSIGAGLKRVDDSDLDLTFNGTSVAKIKFFDSAITYTVGLGLGFRYDMAKGVAVGLETGIRYEGDLDDDDTDLTGLGSFENVNDDGNRLEIPLMARVTIEF